ncbi:MAG: cyclic nucleotide-binding domain-containing protein [Chloroflexi bacterium]|nr:cyclic nucleotide-binding domain-containing protein [Chloroflexota bacterium]
MEISDLLIFAQLPDSLQNKLTQLASQHHYEAGEVLFYQGDPVTHLCILASGRCELLQATKSVERREFVDSGILDAVAALGGLPHKARARALTPVTVWQWPVELLMSIDEFTPTVCRYLASQLSDYQARRAMVEAPVHFRQAARVLNPGPYLFDTATMFFAFCDADLEAVRACLPPGLSVLQRPGRNQAAVLLALADFPRAYPEDNPDESFNYNETTVFVPVRHGTAFGFFVPHIYASAWEPILLGREIYGFPKRFGVTSFDSQRSTLRVDHEDVVDLRWPSSQGTDETRLVGALMAWLGLSSSLGGLAFRAGEVLRQVAGLPGYRRVDVYNRRQLLATDATYETPSFSIDCLTRATFGVLRWYQLTRLDDPVMVVAGDDLAGMNLRLREAYRTTLDMRLSQGKVVQDYL